MKAVVSQVAGPESRDLTSDEPLAAGAAMLGIRNGSAQEHGGRLPGLRRAPQGSLPEEKHPIRPQRGLSRPGQWLPGDGRGYLIA